MMNLVESTCRNALPLPDRREIWDWAHANIDFGDTASFKGPYDVENVPWTRDILRAFKNPLIRKITAVMPPQESGKTVAAEVCLLWRGSNIPSRMAFNTSTDKKAKIWSTTRWQQIMKCCKPIQSKFSESRHDTTHSRIIFRDGGTMLVQGAEAEGNRQSDSIEVQVNDELYLWERPWVKDMQIRTRAYRHTKKILQISVGGTTGSELEDEFLEGTQSEWSHPCPHCKEFFHYTFSTKKGPSVIKFDTKTIVTKGDGTLDLTEFNKTVHAECPNCQGRIDYDEDLIWQMNRAGKFVAFNGSAPEDSVSFRVNSFAIGRRPWTEIVKLWIEADSGRSIFKRTLLKEFIQKELCEFWREDEDMEVIKMLTHGYTLTSVALAPAVKLVNESARFLTIDRQRDHFWCVVRAWRRDGSSRLLYRSLIQTVEQFEDIIKMYEIEPQLVFEDSGYFPEGAYGDCAKRGWTPLKGSGEMFFPVELRGGLKVKRMWSNVSHVQHDGRLVPLIHWASDPIKDILHRFRSNKGPSWEVADDAGRDFERQMTGDRKKEVVNKKTGRSEWRWVRVHANHYWDCEAMQVAAALMLGILASPEPAASEPKEAEVAAT